MKTKLLTLTAFLALFLTANAQVNIEERMKKENVVRGMIIQNGKETEGYIKKVNEKRSLDDVTYNAFDKFQSDISFIPKNDFETAEKLTKKMYVKVEPKTAEGYKYIYESGDTLVYESVKYADKSEISLRMIAKPVFLRVESKGRLEIYTYYVSPPSLLIGNEIREYYEAAGEPIIVYRRAGNEKSPEMIEFLNVEKELADCAEVVRKYQAGEYGVVGNKENQSKFMKFVNKAAVGEEMKYKALVDYNAGICAGE